MARADMRRDVAACKAYLKRGVERWRDPSRDYAPTTDGLYRALREELQHMVDECQRGQCPACSGYGVVMVKASTCQYCEGTGRPPSQMPLTAGGDTCGRLTES